MTVNTFYRHSIYTMKKGDNFGFFMRGKYQFILMFVVGTHVFAKCLQKQRGGGVLKYFFSREGLRVTARERDGALPSKEAKLEPT